MRCLPRMLASSLLLVDDPNIYTHWNNSLRLELRWAAVDKLRWAAVDKLRWAAVDKLRWAAVDKLRWAAVDKLPFWKSSDCNFHHQCSMETQLSIVIFRQPTAAAVLSNHVYYLLVMSLLLIVKILTPLLGSSRSHNRPLALDIAIMLVLIS
uniref:Uncharacterized protein n=1 Tax=Asparagus officinalis TaxID=4686 RepID=Q2AA54_ASPOF|nr:hypothetical protein 19.t00004 [Asparagus officinalis]